jgi:hypothetical protein
VSHGRLLCSLRGGARRPRFNTEAYDRIYDNAWKEVARAPLSTFSSDVDTASYANVRRFLNQGEEPPKDAVRIEELINYFPFDYPEPRDDKPIAVTTVGWQAADGPSIDSLKYQQRATPSAAARRSEVVTVKIRYKQPRAIRSSLIEVPVVDNTTASPEMGFAAAVAEFGMLLRDSEFKG